MYEAEMMWGLPTKPYDLPTVPTDVVEKPAKPKPPRGGKTRGQIIAHLKQHGASRAYHIARTLKKNDGWTHKVLQYLLEDGVVENYGTTQESWWRLR